jgi:multiple sugar transport system substrate-binding protein
MFNKKLVAAILAAVLLLSVVLTGCSGGSETPSSSNDQDQSNGQTDNNNAASSDEKVTITWSTWGNPGELQRFQELNAEYMKLHPNVTIKFMPVPSGYDDKILTQVAGGTAPDAFYAGETLTRKLIKQGKIEEMDPYLDNSSKLKKDDFIPVLLEMAQKDGKTYGLPVDCNPVVLYYNADLIKSVGMKTPQEYYDEGQWTWDIFSQITSKLVATGKKGYILENWWGPFYTWLASNDGKVDAYSEDGKKYLLDSEKNMETLKFLSDAINNGNITYAGSLPQGQGADAMFMSGQVGFTSFGRWTVPIFKKVSFNWDVIPFPTKDGSKDPQSAIAQAFMVMNKSAKNKQAVWEFVEYFNGKEGQTFRLQGNGNAVPSIFGIDEVVTSDTKPEHSEYFINLRNNGFAPFVPEMGVPEVQNDIWDNLDLIWLKKATVEDTVPKIVKSVNDKLANAEP